MPAWSSKWDGHWSVLLRLVVVSCIGCAILVDWTPLIRQCVGLCVHNMLFGFSSDVFQLRQF